MYLAVQNWAKRSGRRPANYDSSQFNGGHWLKNFAICAGGSVWLQSFLISDDIDEKCGVFETENLVHGWQLTFLCIFNMSQQMSGEIWLNKNPGGNSEEKSLCSWVKYWILEKGKFQLSFWQHLFISWWNFSKLPSKRVWLCVVCAYRNT